MKKKDILWGLLFILAAVLILMNQFGVFGIFDGVGMFDIVVTVIMVGIIIHSVLEINFWGILFPMAVICIVFAEEWNITEFTPWPALLTAFLISLGLSMIFKQYGGIWIYHTNKEHSFGKSVINERDDNVVDCSISFGENMKYVNSENFERANIKCSFGSVKVFFDNAQIPSGKAEIYLDVSFGDAQLFIPKTWRIVQEVNVFLGDFEEKNRSLGSEAPVVTIRGNISFGDAQIIYV